MKGNNYGLGDVRKVELKGACKMLGIAEDRCEALNRPELQDNPTKWWDENEIIVSVKQYVQKWNVDAVSLSCEIKIDNTNPNTTLRLSHSITEEFQVTSITEQLVVQ